MAEQLNDITINIDKKAFQNDLIGWFEEEQRDLPWRKNKDPYRVWVSEIMLQQTKVDTVIPYFNRFVSSFPTIADLAQADEEKVLKAWEGLGYYSRVRNLQTAVKEVHEKYAGIVPNTPKEIASLKGVGPYTAGAILSIAYGVPEPAVDGNVMRVFSRILLIEDDIAKASSRKKFEQAVRALISEDNPSYFNQALMELGALICTPTSPSCLLCPVREHCSAFETGRQQELPIKSKKKKAKNVDLLVGMIRNKQGDILIEKRPNEGLLANMWQFPSIERSTLLSDRNQLRAYFAETFLIQTDFSMSSLTTLKHIFTHLVWHLNVFVGETENELEDTETRKFVSVEEIEKYPFPVSHQKIWKQYVKLLH